MQRGNDSGVTRTEGILRAGGSLISLLPSEILSCVFFALEADLVPEYLISATHVCRRWRDTACADPRLWTQIPCGSGPECMNEFFRRSRSLPLRLTLRGQAASRPYVRHFLLQYLARVEKLECDDIEYFSDTLLSPAPLLTHFHASYLQTGISSLPADLFENNARVLSEIELRSIAPNWLSVSFSNLHRLKIDWPMTRKMIPTLLELSSMLSRSPTLAHLTLINCLERPSRDSSTPRVDLPRLTLLHIKAPAPCSSKLLDVISLPADCRLEISSSRYRRVGPQSSLSLLSHIHSHLSKYHESLPDCAYYGIISLSGRRVFVSLRPLQTGDEDCSQQLRFPLETTQEILRLEFPCEYSMEHVSLETWLPMLLEIFGYLPLDRIRDLWLWIKPYGVKFSQEVAYRLLVPCRQLEHLKISLAGEVVRLESSETHECAPIPPGEVISHLDSQNFLPNLSLLEINSRGQEVYFRLRQYPSERPYSYIFYDLLFCETRPRPVETLILSRLQVKDMSWPVPAGESKEILRILHPDTIATMETSEPTFVRSYES